MMTASALGDRFGRRRLFTIGLGLFVAASAACAVAPGIGGLIAARAVQGAGAALVAPLALALLSAAFLPERRAWALGIFSAVTGLAVLGGPMIGAAITQGISWQWIFWLNVPIGLAVILLARRGVSESFGPNTALDIPASDSRPAQHSASSGASCAATQSAGAAPRSSPSHDDATRPNRPKPPRSMRPQPSRQQSEPESDRVAAAVPERRTSRAGREPSGAV